MNELPPLNNDFLFKHNIQQKISIAQGKHILDLNLDLDVFLPTKGMNLQRGFVWTLQQKQALIESIMLRRNIPQISIVYTDDDICEVIDGKQRLSALISYLKDEFEYCGYKYSNLPRDYQLQIHRFHIEADRLLPEYGVPITDDEKIEWFRLINFAGTPQDSKHLEKLLKAKGE